MALPTVVLIFRNIFWFLTVAWLMLTPDTSELLGILSKFYANDSCANVECGQVTHTSSSGTGFAAIQECVTVYERRCSHALSQSSGFPVSGAHRELPFRLSHSQLIVSK